MRRYALLLLGAIGLLAGAGYLVWLFFRSLYSAYSDWKLYKELDELEAIGRARRKARAEQNQKRLDNGCPHVFQDPSGVLPPKTCVKCGIEKQRPKGGCDHRWKPVAEPVPHAVCEACGQQYRAEPPAGPGPSP